MRMYLFSLGAGLMVGVIYSLINVRSPAPPLVALVGLLGILFGEQIIPLTTRMITGTSLDAAWRQASCGHHIFGSLPGRTEIGQVAVPAQAAPVNPKETSL